MTRFCKKLFYFLFIIFAITSYSFGEQITDRDFGFSLDIPEGFEIADYTEDGMSYVFSHPNIHRDCLWVVGLWSLKKIRRYFLYSPKFIQMKIYCFEIF